MNYIKKIIDDAKEIHKDNDNARSVFHLYVIYTIISSTLGVAKDIFILILVLELLKKGAGQ